MSTTTFTPEKARISIPFTMAVSAAVALASISGTWYVARYRLDETESSLKAQTAKIESLANAVSELAGMVRLNQQLDAEQQTKIENLTRDAVTDRATLARIATDVAVIRDRIERARP